jgi:hypothetical protein
VNLCDALTDDELRVLMRWVCDHQVSLLAAGRPTFRRRDGDPPGPLSWLVPSPRAVAHLFAPGAPRSRCGQVHRELRPGDDRLRIAPPGRRGCRPCAVSAGLIDTIAEGVTT